MANLTLKNISKSFGDITAVENVNLQVMNGEFIVLVGPSGCGKSTILRMIAGLDTIGQGEILIDDTQVNDLPPKDRDIAMVFQNYALYPHMTVSENLAFALRLRKTDKATINSRVSEVADTLGLTELLNRRPRELSGGQQQRTALGRAMVRNPKLFLFDEPLSNLDAKLRVLMRTELIKLHKKLQATMIYVTHDQVEAMSLGNRLVVLENGRVQQIGPPLEIYRNPANLFVAGFIGSPSMNLIPTRIKTIAGELYLEVEKLTLPLPESIRQTLRNFPQPPDALILGIRPEDIHAQAESPPAGTWELPLNVEIIEPLGNESLASCLFGTHPITVRLHPGSPIKADHNYNFVFDLDKINFFHPDTGKRLT